MARLQLGLLLLGVGLACVAVVYGAGQRAGRLAYERDAARARVDVLKDAQEIEDDVDDLARDGDALRRELDRRLSGSDPR